MGESAVLCLLWYLFSFEYVIIKTFPHFYAMKYWGVKILILISALLLSACGTLFSPEAKTVWVRGDSPAEAKVYIDGHYVGLAPVEVPILRDVRGRNPMTIEVKAEGYNTFTMQSSKEFRVGVIVLDIFFTSYIGIIVDAITGNHMKQKFYNNEVRYSLFKRENEKF